MPPEDRRALLRINTGDHASDDGSLESIFHITRLRGHEAISQLFQFTLELGTTDTEAQAGQLIGQSVTVSLLRNLDQASLDDDSIPNYRFITGIISRATAKWTGGEGSDALPYRKFTVTVVPDIWKMGKTSQSRVFHGKTAWEVVELILPDTTAFNTDNIGRPVDANAREHCMQYRESDLDFAQRLLEDEGIAFYFRQPLDSNGQVDHSNQLVLFDGEANVDESPQEGGLDYINEHQNVVTQNYRAVDYKPTEANVTFDAKTNDPLGSSFVHDFPAASGPRDTMTVDQVDEIAQRRLDSIAATSTVYTGRSESVTFSAGHYFTVDAEGADVDGSEMLLVYVTHSLNQPPPTGAGSRSGGTGTYSNTFTCAPKTQAYRPLVVTPKPQLRGPQTGVVEGPSGATNNVHTDQFGRVKVRFHWDHRDELDDANALKGSPGSRSAWIRVSESWAGVDHGTVFLPHIGDEVIVGFLEGDIDRPIVTGRVYNSSNPPMRASDDTSAAGSALDPHRMVIKDRAGNEIVMNSEPGKEAIQLNSPLGGVFATYGNPQNPSSATSGPVSVVNSSGNASWFQKGNKSTGTLGSNTDVLIGNKYSLHAGFATGVVVGGGASLYIGTSGDLKVGHAYSHRFGQSIERSKGNKRVDGDSDHTLTAKKTMSLAGGVGGDSGGDKTAIVELDGGFARMSVGVDKEASLPASKNIQRARWAAAAAAATSILGVFTTNLIMKDPDNDEVLDDGIFLGIGALSVICAGVLAFKDTSKVKKRVSHVDSAADEPSAMVDLTIDGDAVISGTNSVDLRAVAKVPHQFQSGAETKQGPQLLLTKKPNPMVELYLDAKEKDKKSSLAFKGENIIMKTKGNLEVNGKTTKVIGKSKLTLKVGSASVMLTSSKMSALGNLDILK